MGSVCKDDDYEETSRRLGDYRCQGQLSLFDITQDDKYKNEPDDSPIEVPDIEVIGQMSIFDFIKEQ